jgi:GDPmannose 4,6-dehydratase
VASRVVRRALVTGASGQDGHYLTRHLVDQGREVMGISLGLPTQPVGQHVDLDITRHHELKSLVKQFSPHEIYHLAAYHRSSAADVELSPTEEEELYFRHNVEATRHLLGAAADLPTSCRVFLAGSSHLFGDATECPQTEATPIRPNTVYGLTKAIGLWLGRHYREKRGLFCVTGILYNHESPLRNSSFITARIARTVAQIIRGEASELVIGDLDAQVDWGFAGDYVRAMVLMLEASEPQDCIIASGELHRIRDFVELAFGMVGLEWQRYVRQSSNVHHPVSSAIYHGDVTVIRRLGWSPRVSFEELVRMMVAAHQLH